ncbi:SapC family protein [Roseateles sp. BYS87W]|uniref:SapC family protein n=1 Tax=Pelomonas baiyunensis TaxID=3299026 RepID=A0ABW7GWT2_9BURK
MLQLLNNITHKDLRVVTQRGAQWGDNVMSALITPDEFRSVQAHYPILFQPDGEGGYQAVALFGLEQGQNLFLTADGWDAEYLPLSMQRLPFSIGVTNGELRMMVDMASPRISHGAEGEAVFLPHGGTTDFIENANTVLRTLHEGLEAAPEFMQALVAHELLESVRIEVERPDGSRGELVGFFIIHEERLASLDAATIGLLHEADYLQPIYMAIASLSHLPALIRRHLALNA